MVTAEMAAALPVLVVVLAVVMTAVATIAVRIRAQDAAREAARAAGRGDIAVARRLSSEMAPDARLSLSVDARHVVAVIHAQVHPFGDWLPTLTVSERSVAAIEPRTTP